ncbi:hypothetical protein HMPREF1138_0085 [Actinomyces sp. ICM58]|nr:hypothetical protein HMPREF1138_0085 [Actinomyces sp. ICM58]
MGQRGRGVAVCGCAMHEYSVVPGPVVITKLTSGHAICADRHVQTFVTPGWFVGIVIRGEFRSARFSARLGCVGCLAPCLPGGVWAAWPLVCPGACRVRSAAGAVGAALVTLRSPNNVMVPQQCRMQFPCKPFKC